MNHTCLHDDGGWWELNHRPDGFFLLLKHASKKQMFLFDRTIRFFPLLQKHDENAFLPSSKRRITSLTRPTGILTTSFLLLPSSSSSSSSTSSWKPRSLQRLFRRKKRIFRNALLVSNWIGIIFSSMDFHPNNNPPINSSYYYYALTFTSFRATDLIPECVFDPNPNSNREWKITAYGRVRIYYANYYAI